MQFILKKILIKAEAFNIKHSSDELKRNEWKERFAISIVSFICFSKELFSSYLLFYFPLPFMMMMIIIIIMMRLPPTKKMHESKKKKKILLFRDHKFILCERTIYLHFKRENNAGKSKIIQSLSSQINKKNSTCFKCQKK